MHLSYKYPITCQKNNYRAIVLALLVYNIVYDDALYFANLMTIETGNGAL